MRAGLRSGYAGLPAAKSGGRSEACLARARSVHLIIHSAWRRPIGRWFGLALLAAMLCVVTPHRAESHPHAWIDVSVEVLFDPSGRVVGLRESWLFDEYYTVFVLRSAEGGVADQAALDALMHGNLESLYPYDYFTVVTNGGERVGLSAATDASTRLVDNRLEMTFVVPFAAPSEAIRGPLTYAVYDPTYYVEMLHAERAEAIKLVDAPESCAYRLAAPDPNPEVLSLAAALDRTQSAGDGLGQYFAERVTVRCD